MTDEFAPGIPAARTRHGVPATSKPAVWEFGLHRHLAERAGEHFDLRLGDPTTGHAHSWAMRYWPKPGEHRLAVAQPTHTLAYMDFKGEIPRGTYGAGKVELARRDKTEVLSSSADHVRFNLYPGRETEEYLLRRTKGAENHWLLSNVTHTRANTPVPMDKPAYREQDLINIDPEAKGTVLQAKVDGAHVVYHFGAEGSTPRVYSYRHSKLSPTGLIHHTPKLPGAFTRKTPKALANSVLRGELLAVDNSGKALPAARIGGILNSGVWKSRETQKTEGHLVPMVFDVSRWRGKDAGDMPYSEKRKIIDEVVKHAPWLKEPRTAVTAAAKKTLIADIIHGREPSTEEGVIEWHADRSVPVKAKVSREQDVFVRNVFPEEGKRSLAGGFEFTRTPDGPVIGRVGTGFSHALKAHMHANPGAYVGLRAKIKSTPAPEHYAPRAPVFAGWHLDQEIPEGVVLDTNKMAADLRDVVPEEPAMTSPGAILTTRDGVLFNSRRPRVPLEDKAGARGTKMQKHAVGQETIARAVAKAREISGTAKGRGRVAGVIARSERKGWQGASGHIPSSQRHTEISSDPAVAKLYSSERAAKVKRIAESGASARDRLQSTISKKAFDAGFADAVKTAIDVSKLDPAKKQQLVRRLGGKSEAMGEDVHAKGLGTDASRRSAAARIRTESIANRLKTNAPAPQAAPAAAKTTVTRRPEHVSGLSGGVSMPNAKTIARPTAGLVGKAQAAASSAMAGGTGKVVEHGALASGARRAAQGKGILAGLKHSDPAVREKARSVAKKFMALKAAT